MAVSRLTLKPPRSTSASSATFLPDIQQAIDGRARSLSYAFAQLREDAEVLAEAVALLVNTLQQGGKVLVAGNGGSAAEAQHFAAELAGRFKRERRPLAAIALTADSATLTSIANDYGYAEVFARQVQGFGAAGDVLVLFSTSGASPNVVNAATVAQRIGMDVIAITGRRPSALANAATLTIHAPLDDTPEVQEIHTIVLHLLCDLVEREFAGDEA